LVCERLGDGSRYGARFTHIKHGLLDTKEYSQQNERHVRWDVLKIGISWLIKEGVILSERDKKCSPLGGMETNFKVLI